MRPQKISPEVLKQQRIIAAAEKDYGRALKQYNRMMKAAAAPLTEELQERIRGDITAFHAYEKKLGFAANNPAKGGFRRLPETPQWPDSVLIDYLEGHRFVNHSHADGCSQIPRFTENLLLPRRFKWKTDAEHHTYLALARDAVLVTGEAKRLKAMPNLYPLSPAEIAAYSANMGDDTKWAPPLPTQAEEDEHLIKEFQKLHRGRPPTPSDIAAARSTLDMMERSGLLAAAVKLQSLPSRQGPYWESP